MHLKEVKQFDLVLALPSQMYQEINALEGMFLTPRECWLRSFGLSPQVYAEVEARCQMKGPWMCLLWPLRERTNDL